MVERIQSSPKYVYGLSMAIATVFLFLVVYTGFFKAEAFEMYYFDNKVPFYVALPGPTIDWQMADGVNGIPIEQRDSREVTHVAGKSDGGQIESVQITPDGVSARNYAFDVTPARLITGLFTERGVCEASESGLLGLYPEHKRLGT